MSTEENQPLKHVSWYPNPELNTSTEKYLKMIEAVFRIQKADGKWYPLKLTQHQREFHSGDIAIKGHEAINDDVIKSRNTSFTISSAIRLLTGNYNFRDEVVPIGRINESKVKELIAEIKKLIRNMRPIILANGDMWPFDPKKAILNNMLEITFPDRAVIFRGYPANASAAENIRGLRITRGLLDETNFFSSFVAVYTAMRDASRGSIDGKKYFQITIGSTLKSNTPYSMWHDKMKKLGLSTFRFLEWQVFDPKLFDKDKPVIEQNLTPIVEWHEIEDLNNKQAEDLNTFLEEYMAVRVPADSLFYNLVDVMAVVDSEKDSSEKPIPGAIYYIGVDVASVHDYFVISIFQKINKHMKQRYLFYINKIELPAAQNKVESIIELFNPVKARIDTVGVGLQLTQYCQGVFGHNIVEGVFGGTSIKGLNKKHRVTLKEFIHTNQKAMILRNQVTLLNDELQLRHYGQWKHDFTADSNAEIGHGDTVVANGYALLEDNWRLAKIDVDDTPVEKAEDITDADAQTKVREFNKSGYLNKMKFYGKAKVYI